MRTGAKPPRLLQETLLALLVLALTFLNFGHTSAVFAAGGRVVITATSVCGDPLSTSAGDHFACHACRPAAAVLPPPPAGVAPVQFAVAPVVYTPPLASPAALPFRLAASPRGPPAA